MIERYRQLEIDSIWNDESKLELWQLSELAMIQARSIHGEIPPGVFEEMREILLGSRIDIEKWKMLDTRLKHDLNAFLQERKAWLPEHLRPYFHAGNMTSYDTEEPAFVTMLMHSVNHVMNKGRSLLGVLSEGAQRWRHTPMMARTHGQEAQIQSFGKRELDWYVELDFALGMVAHSAEFLAYSRMSGAIGNYDGVNPEVEKTALGLLGLKPFYGATQIMPRVLYVPLASALTAVVMVLNRIDVDFRLGARSGRPLYQEPFGKLQMGSSAMPHKKNTITAEQGEGMARVAKGYLLAIVDNVVTWEERAIEQSCVERVAWPDLFHVAVHSLKAVTRMISGMRVYPDNMLREIVESRGCYASSVAKDFLKQHGSKVGIADEDAYRIIQLSAFNVHEPDAFSRSIRQVSVLDDVETDQAYAQFAENLGKSSPLPESIEEVIATGQLRVSDELGADRGTVETWNLRLVQLFSDRKMREEWHELFKLSNRMAGERVVFDSVLPQPAAATAE